MANSDSSKVPVCWAHEAKGIIDIDDSTDLRWNQAADLAREAKMRKWWALAIKLDLVHPGVCDRDMLLNMQQYFATTPHEMQCPCTRGVVLATIQDHYLKCDAIPAFELKQKQLAEVDVEKIKLDLRRQQMNARGWMTSRRPSTLATPRIRPS